MSKTKTSKFVPHILRQGDVLLAQIHGIPEGAQPVDVKGRLIVAHGEVTGHHHSLAEGTATMYKQEVAGNSVTILATKESVPIEHQEHSPLTLNPDATYVHVHQKEYKPEAIVNVRD